MLALAYCSAAMRTAGQVELQYGFAYESYHIRQYYWEAVVLLQKLLLVTLATLLQRISQGLQVLVALVIISLASILQVGH
jgi:hypothetical protein